MAQVPINPDLLQWAMVEANSSVEDLARATKRDADTVSAWLHGSKKPTKGDLSSLSKRLGRAAYFFLLPEPPKRRPVQAWYRDAVRGEASDVTAELNEVRQAQRRQRIVRWALAQSDQEQPVSLPRLSGDPAQDAADLRALLEWDTVSHQVKASSKSATFKTLRTRVEALGVMVQLRDIGIGNCRGFSLPDPIAPLVVVNSAHTLGTVRSFTILHELAHLARGEERVCYERDNGQERYCNRLAANFLMPAASLASYIKYKHWDSFSDYDTEPVRLIANRYKTSWFSVAIRLNELGYASRALIETVRAGGEDEWKDGQSGGGSGGEPYTRPLRRVDEFGSTFTIALLSARAVGSLSELETRKQLRVTGAELAQVASIARSRAG